MEYPDNGITAMKCVMSKGATVEGRLYLLTRNVLWRYVFRISGLGI